MAILLILIMDFIFGLVCYALAKRKGRNTGCGFLTGLFFTVIALIYYIAVSPKVKPSQ